MRLLALILLLPVSVAMSADYYCDPIKGDTKAGDGTAAKPWGTLESVCAAKLIHTSDATKGKVHAGDTIKLRSGNHGRPNMQGIEYTATAMTTIEADVGHKPVLSSMFCARGIRNWTYRGISVQSPGTELPKWTKAWTLDSVDTVVVEDCEVRTAADATQWGDKEWETRCPWYGLYVSGGDITVRNCRFTGLENCLYTGGDRVEVLSNNFEYFINDAIEHSANNIRIAGNRITDLYHLASNEFHHDGMQGWNFAATPLRNVLIENNYVAYSSGKYPKVPAIGNGAIFQGIVFFDGSWANVVVRNNVVMLTGYHGITIYEAADSVIENNTIVYQGKDRPEGPPWVGIFPRNKDGSVIEPRNVMIRNNISPTYNLFPRGVSVENSFAHRVPQKPWDKAFTVVEPSKTFRVYEPDKCRFDLTTREDSPAAGRLKTIRVDGAGAVQ